MSKSGRPPVQLKEETGAQIKAKVVEVTPTLASELLERGFEFVNRPLRDWQVRQHANDMKAGKFDSLNGQTIVLDEDGRVIDGQHRLWAIIESNASIPFLVVEGAERDRAYMTLDIGRRRTISDALAMREEVQAHQLGSILVFYYQYRRGVIRASTGRGQHPSTEALLRLLDSDPDRIRASVKFSAQSQRWWGHPTPVAVAWLALGDVNDRVRDEFFDLLHTGLVATPNHPLYILRERLIRDRNSTRGRMPREEVLAIVIKAWNAWLQGRMIQQLGWRSRGDGSEPFPTPAEPEENFLDGSSTTEEGVIK